MRETHAGGIVTDGTSGEAIVGGIKESPEFCICTV
jgi:hypothetical protein